MRATTALLAILMVAAAPAHAEEWWMMGSVGKPTERIVYFADAEVSTVDGYRHLWTERVLEQEGAHGESLVRSLFVLDCDRRRFAEMEQFLFDDAGEQLPRAKVIPAWSFVPPSTMGATLMRFGCNAERPPSGNIGTQDRQAFASVRVFGVSTP